MVARRYELVEEIGAGATCTVWRATDLYRGVPVALKLLKATPEVSDVRTAAEVIALRRTIPGMVTLLDSSVDGDQRFLVMELIDGAPFPGRPLPCPWPALREMVLALLETLAALHAEGIVHRDLKPDNVLVDRGGHPVLLDFGIARVARVDAPGITHKGFVYGTWRYAAPEQMRHETTLQSDLYALGVMVQEALTGSSPFGEHHDVASLYVAKLRGVAEPLARRAPSVDEADAAVLDRLLAADPARRPASALEALVALRRERRSQPHGASLGALGGLPELGAGEAWSEVALRALFGDRDPLRHRAADAAAALFSLTRGAPERVRAVLASWERARLVEGSEVLMVARSTLDRHLADVERDDFSRPSGRLARAALPDGATEAQRQLALHVELLSPSCTIQRLADTLAWERDEVTAAVAGLLALGAVAVAGDAVALTDYFGLTSAQRGGGAVGRTRQRALDALPAGTPGRLRHVAGARMDPSAVASEALLVAARHAAEGHLPRAEAVLDEAMRALLGARGGAPGDPALRDGVLGLWTRVALSQRTTRASDVALYELCRDDAPASDLVANLRRLVRAHQATDHWTEEAWALAVGVLPFADEDLEVWRASTLVSAARKKSADAFERQVTTWRAIADGRATPSWRGRSHFWRGRLRYGRGAYGAAAEDYLVSSEVDPWACERLHGRVSAASALMEAGELARARAMAEGAADGARARRLPFHEARATWVARASQYRLDPSGMRPDLALAEAAVQVARDQGVLLCLSEASVAWRRRDAAALRVINDLHQRVAHPTVERLGSPLIEAMAHDVVAPLPPAQAEAVLGRALGGGVSSLIVQVAALLGPAVARAQRARVAPHAEALARAEEVERRRVREVLSHEECFVRLSY